MADAGRSATKVRASARKASASAKSGASRSRPSSAKKSTTSNSKTSAAKGSKASRSKSPAAKSSRTRGSSASAAKKPSTSKGGATTTVQRPASRSSASRSNGNGVDVRLPVLTPHLRTVHVPTPGMAYVEDAGRVVAGYLPPPGRLAFYGGLGVAAVVGLLDWPVAAAIGVATVIARRTTGRGGTMRERSRT